MKAFGLIFLSIGIVTILFGVFSFIGLIAPHILRKFNFFRKDVFSEIVFGSALTGFLFAIIDQICFLFPIQGAEIPIGMVVSVIGPLIFLFVYLNNKDSIDYIY